MKIIHTSDWHLGATLYGHDRLDDHREMLRQLTETVASEQPDAMLVSGDIFDNSSPSAAAERLLDSDPALTAPENRTFSAALAAMLDRTTDWSQIS